MDMKDFKLNTHPKINSGFEIPEGYFDNFSSELMKIIPDNEVKVISFYARNKNWIFTVAAILVITITIPVMNHFNNTNDAVYNKEIENYLTSRGSFNDDEIVNLLNEEDIAKLKINTPIDANVTEDILSENANIEEYITN